MKTSASVVLRPCTLDDIPRLFDAVMESKEELSPWMPWCHAGYSLEDSRTWIETQLAAFQGGAEYAFVISDSADQVLGGCGLNRLDRPNLRANLGYWVRSSAGGCGVATTAVKLLVKWAFSQTEFCRLEVIASVENKASQRVAEKAGAVCEGVLRSRLQLQCRLHDAAIYSFVRET